MDNLDNSFQKAFDRMVELAGDKASNMKFIKARQGVTLPGCLACGWRGGPRSVVLGLSRTAIRCW